MSSFKIYIEKGSKTVLINGKFDAFPNYSSLRQAIIQKTQNASMKANKQNIEETDNFKLIIQDEKDLPEELSQGIFNEETYQIFKNKIISNGNKGKYKLYIEKVDSLPVFKKKENTEILDENLKKYWNLTLENLTTELNLMKLEESANLFDKMKREHQEKEEKLKNVKHENIICSICFKKDFFGKRFICSECNNFNLCQECEKKTQEKEIHPKEHVLIQINKKLDEDIMKYNNIIGNYRKEFQNVDEMFTLEFTVVNNGEEDLQNCYIFPIRYGDEYLSCDAKIITNSIKRGMNLKMSLDVRTPKILGNFKGLFRMFSPKGLPFGNIINIKVLNGN